MTTTSQPVQLPSSPSPNSVSATSSTATAQKEARPTKSLPARFRLATLVEKDINYVHGPNGWKRWYGPPIPDRGGYHCGFNPFPSPRAAPPPPTIEGTRRRLFSATEDGDGVGVSGISSPQKRLKLRQGVFPPHSPPHSSALRAQYPTSNVRSSGPRAGLRDSWMKVVLQDGSTDSKNPSPRASLSTAATSASNADETQRPSHSTNATSIDPAHHRDSTQSKTSMDEDISSVIAEAGDETPHISTPASNDSNFSSPSDSTTHRPVVQDKYQDVPVIDPRTGKLAIVTIPRDLGPDPIAAAAYQKVIDLGMERVEELEREWEERLEREEKERKAIADADAAESPVKLEEFDEELDAFVAEHMKSEADLDSDSSDGEETASFASIDNSV